MYIVCRIFVFYLVINSEQVLNSLNEIFEQTYSPLCNYAHTIIRDYHQAEDIVQNIFIQLWKNEKLTRLENPEPYLIQCVKFKCIDFLRKMKTNAELSVDVLPDIEKSHEFEFDEDDVEAVFAFLTSKLPPKTRQVFLMSRRDGLTYAEIAEELDVSKKTVENQMGAALKKMKESLIKYNYLPAFFQIFDNYFSQH